VADSPLDALCRDCFARLDGGGDSVRCRACGSPRLVRHTELNRLSVAHVDCDAFYASVEKRDNPELADRPVIIGGGRRGVVAAACYVARTFGVRSAMPMFKALKACPEAVVIRPDMAKYVRVGRAVRDMMLALTPAVEPLSIDEAFLDLAGTERLHHAPPAVTLARFQRRIEAEIGVTASIGLSHNKFLAKVASDIEKPRGFTVIGRAETLSFLAAQPVSVIWGVGSVMRERLARDGITGIAHLQHLDEATLARRYGSMGLRLARLARGEDDRLVKPDREAKSVSAETTFDKNIAGASELLPRLRGLAEKVSARLKQQGTAGRTIVLKLKRADFHLITRQARLDFHTDMADRIFRAGRDLLLRELDGSEFRLIGIGVADLGAADLADAPDLLDPQAARRDGAERAMDAIRARFGPDGLALGLNFEPKARTRPQGRGQS
jgi:DNA polymerase IV